jgi:hypothetical protein
MGDDWFVTAPEGRSERPPTVAKPGTFSGDESTVSTAGEYILLRPNLANSFYPPFSSWRLAYEQLMRSVPKRRKTSLRDFPLLICQVVFPFQAAFPKWTATAAIASTRSPRGCDPVLFENVPEGRFKIAIPGQQVFEEFDAEERDTSLE